MTDSNQMQKLIVKHKLQDPNLGQVPKKVAELICM